MAKADPTPLEPSLGEIKPAGQVTPGSCSLMSPNRAFGTPAAPQLNFMAHSCLRAAADNAAGVTGVPPHP